LSQRVFQTIAAAADDMAAVFGDDTPELTSLLVIWALQVPLSEAIAPAVMPARATGLSWEAPKPSQHN